MNCHRLLVHRTCCEYNTTSAAYTILRRRRPNFPPLARMTVHIVLPIDVALDVGLGDGDALGIGHEVAKGVLDQRSGLELLFERGHRLAALLGGGGLGDGASIEARTRAREGKANEARTRTGDLRYVCFGGSLGKYDGTSRRVRGPFAAP